ncbi:MAG: cytochrome d ubiquinol oxidase subunit II [Verrucomicrobia bacterium]|nr:cytochrome d ubiquinol oxidase subunit II [Verrucomicrobiota bacterium]
MDLNTIWFGLVGILLTGYAVLDGFDLGTGTLLLFTKDDHERRIFLNAIGPIWNGNEVWLVTGGGALFAAFPNVYASVFSGFYDAFILLLFALIFRAVGIEFRSRHPSPRWRRTWDVAFAVSSFVSALLIGVAMGNLLRGIPLSATQEYQGDFLTLLNPYSLLVGLTSVSLMTMHANLYLILKTEGELQKKLERWARRTVPAYLGCFALLNAVTLASERHLQDRVYDRRWLLAVLCVASVAVTFNILREVRRNCPGRAFISSCLSIITMMTLFAATMYPQLVMSYPNLQHSLDIYNGASTDKSLRFMFVVALLGVPLVLVYTISIYYMFRGKVTLTEESY